MLLVPIVHKKKRTPTKIIIKRTCTKRIIRTINNNSKCRLYNDTISNRKITIVANNTIEPYIT